MSKANIVLCEKKAIKGSEYDVGTVLGEVDINKKFSVEDIDKAMQIGQIRFQAVAQQEDKKQKAGK